jgi:outer membrane protein assembly factor BamB
VLYSLLLSIVGSQAEAQSIPERILWNLEFGPQNPPIPALGHDGSIYLGLKTSVLAVSSSGVEQWRVRPEGADYIGFPVIGADGTVYVAASGFHGDKRGYLYAFDPEGTEKWRYSILPEAVGSGINFIYSPAIGQDGTLLFSATGDSTLRAVGPDGQLRWQYKAEALIGRVVVGADGTVYMSTGDGYVNVLTAAGELQWRFSTGVVPAASVGVEVGVQVTAVGPEGTLYVVISGALLAMDRDGELLWRYDLPVRYGVAPVVDREGQVFCVFPLANADGLGMILSLTRSGQEYWRSALGWVSQTRTPLLGADDTLYLMGYEGGRIYLFALDAIGGREFWRVGLDSFGNMTMSDTGIIYLAGEASLTAIQTDSPGLVNSSWPVVYGDAQNSQHVSGPATAVLETEQGGLPVACRLGPSYPNPFNAGTVIPFELPAAGLAEVRVYGLLGQEVALLAKGWFTAGRHQVRGEWGILQPATDTGGQFNKPDGPGQVSRTERQKERFR